MSKLTIGQIFRTARPYSSAPKIVDNYTNHFYATYSSGQNLALLDSGINPMGKVKDKGGQRQPAILIRRTPIKSVLMKLHGKIRSTLIMVTSVISAIIKTPLLSLILRKGIKLFSRHLRCIPLSHQKNECGQHL